jgi:hypothetical protein
MKMYGDKIPMATQAERGCGTLNPNVPTLMETLTYRREQLAKELRDIDNAIQGLEENPQVEKVLDLIRKTGRW